MKKMVTIKDVAKDAGVSYSTVSRVANGISSVDSEMRKRVLVSMKKLKYAQNKTAQTLVTNKSMLIGIIVEDIKNPYHNLLLKGIISVLKIHGYNVIICENEFLESECIKNFNNLVERNVDGILFTSTKAYTNEIVDKIQEIYNSGLPIVIPHNFGIDNIPSITYNDAKPVNDAISYLYSLGHRKIALIGGNCKDISTIRKVVAYKEFMMKMDNFDESLIFYSDYDDISVIDITKKILKNNEITAIFTVDDLLAYAAIHCINSKGLSVPNNISVIGYNDIASTKYYVPALTTVDVNITTLGKTYALKIMELLENEFDPLEKYESIIHVPQLVIRDSCSEVKSKN